MFGFINPSKLKIPAREDCLPGRSVPIAAPEKHFVNGSSMHGPWPGSASVIVAMGCFWGAERKFWTLRGVINTAVGYAGGHTPNPTYREVCSGATGHTEVVRVVYDPSVVTLGELLRVFWENHDPTQGMRQGNDVGTQYRSAIYTSTAADRAAAEASAKLYAPLLQNEGYGAVTTEIADAGPFYFAEEYHQQYLAKNPDGYCGIGGTGVSCPVGTGR